MKNLFIQIAESIPAVLQNTHLNVNLQGWPAAAAVIAVSISGVTAYAIWAYSSISDETALDQQDKNPH